MDEQRVRLRKASVAIFFFTMLLSNVYGQYDANINGSFESSSVTVGGDTSAVEGWVFNRGGDAVVSFEIVDSPVKDGERSLSVAVAAAGTNAWDIEALSFPLDVVPGETYRYSVWARANASGATAAFTVGNPSFNEFIALRDNINIGSAWQLFSTEFTVPANEDTLARGPIHFSFAANVSDTLYIDSLRITQLTGLPPDPTTFPVIVEAESGTKGNEFDSLSTGDIQYISISTGHDETSGTGNYPGANRTVSYQVTFADTGTYDLFARLRVGPDGFDDDSFFYGNGFGIKAADSANAWILVNQMNEAGYALPDCVVYNPGGLANGIWKWINVSRNAYTGEPPIQFSIDTPDSLTRIFEIGAREDGLDLDKFAFGRSNLFFTVTNLDSVQPGSETFPAEPPLQLTPIADGKEKFLGNVYSGSQAQNFTSYWNQVTPENAGKWGSVEGSRDNMNWGGMDAAYALAKDNGFPFRFHVLVWGNQQPAWIESLDSTEQIEEIKEWFQAVAERYPGIDYLEVVNEPLHDPPNGPGDGNYILALGGTNGRYGTGWDWIITAFELAREYFPSTTKLMINDYGIVNDNTATTTYINIINLLRERGLIDGIGVQAHAFNTRGSMATVRSNLNRLAQTGLPIQACEMDIDGPTDQVQLDDYERIFPTFWEHPGVEGVTLWGWRPGLWRDAEMAYIMNEDGTERPAMTWLREYVETSDVEIVLVGITEKTDGLPKEFRVYNNYPNPFNPATKIRYDVAKTSDVAIDIFDVTGRLVGNLVKDVHTPGSYTVTFDARNLSSGIYFYRYKAGSHLEMKRMILIK